MDVDSSALYIARTTVDFDDESSNFIIACTGKYVCQTDDFESSNISQNVKDLIQEAFNKKQHISNKECFVGYYQTSSSSSSVLYIEFEDDGEHFKASLAELFATNVALILESLAHQQEVERTQKELLYIVGEAIEARSENQGAHVRRVALICELLAKKLDLKKDFIEAIRLAAPLHDIGKLGIPEKILKKRDKLNDEEWMIMKTHTQIGAALLKKSSVNVSKLASKLALYHHENWDGTGYPEGLSGDDIPLEARIMAVADVFDSLGSERCYKSAWSLEEIKAYLFEQKGIKFQPDLIDLFLTNFDEFVLIREQHPDILE